MSILHGDQAPTSGGTDFGNVEQYQRHIHDQIYDGETRALFRSGEALRQFRCAEHVYHAPDIKAIVAKPNSTLAPDNPRISSRGCPNIRYFIADPRLHRGKEGLPQPRPCLLGV
jgi:hypothetical protein